MTDETTELPVGETPAEETAADAAPATATAVVEHAAAPEPVSFWHRPNVERYLLPLITPILVVLGILDLGAQHVAHLPVGARPHPGGRRLDHHRRDPGRRDAISNSRHMRSQSAILMTARLRADRGHGGLARARALGGEERRRRRARRPRVRASATSTSPRCRASSSRRSSVQAKTGIYCITLIDQSTLAHARFR